MDASHYQKVILSLQLEKEERQRRALNDRTIALALLQVVSDPHVSITERYTAEKELTRVIHRLAE